MKYDDHRQLEARSVGDEFMRKSHVNGRPAMLTKAAMLFLVVLCGLAAAQSTTAQMSATEVKYRKTLFKKEQVSVFLLDIPPDRASLMHRHDTDLLTIFFEGGYTKGTIYGRAPKEERFAVGDVRFRPPGFTHSTENVGNKDFRAVILEFSSPTGPIQTSMPPNTHSCDPVGDFACVDEKYVLCTDKFCVVDVSLAAGGSWTGATTANRFLVAISDCELSYKAKGKSTKIRKLKSGTVEYVPRGNGRQWRNIAAHPARIIAVVFR
jgi:quercetin dioxygenase-like cupin family protein